MVNVQFLQTSVVLKIRKNSYRDILSVKPDLRCTKTVNFQITVGLVINTAVRRRIPSVLPVHVIIRTGITAESTEAAQNILFFPMITGFPLIMTAFHLRKFCSSFRGERYHSRFKQTGQKHLWVHGFNAA